ncbi:hypothetical protein [Aeoliella mucimassa]|uniref:Uncharacterized protein n=1 Tax=Aeoliella mucimassa TaxID=2527972 RepID=A0A518AI29_9BACT|nr:hypothetical protein [Aeoliella mucimassa]QDU54379.1 hypothetical protein Pan181_05600 [Aeoliella mucimassa]
MNTERTNTTTAREIPDEAWDVFLPDDEQPYPEEGDFWFDLLDMDEE